MDVLVLASHPDDEVIGVGGTIAKHVKDGDSIFLVVLTRAHEPFWPKKIIEKKSGELMSIVNFLKIKKLFWLDFKTASLNSVPAIEISKKLEKIIAEVNPNIIYAPPKGDIHIDHDIVGVQILSASRKARNLKKLLFYEEPQNTGDNSTPYYFIPNYFVDISAYIETKIQALNMYKSEEKKFPHPRSAKTLKMAAAARGNVIGVKYAEAFMLIKEIIS